MAVPPLHFCNSATRTLVSLSVNPGEENTSLFTLPTGETGGASLKWAEGCRRRRLLDVRL